jgi:phosphatidylserine/phosphatidylglycerophosphate/cardiolipin synthase-like enzyme
MQPSTKQQAPSALSGLESRYFPPSGGTDVAPVSRRSEIEPFIDGHDYFGQLNAEINALGAGDAWYVAGWAIDVGFTFASGETLGDLLKDRAAAGVDVRVIFWVNRQVLEYPSLAGALELGDYRNLVIHNIRGAEALRADASLAGRVLIDWSGNAASSHHMKVNVFSMRGSLGAFVGGIDYLQDRLAVPPHDRPEDAWHDAGVFVNGEAAKRVLDTVVTRWTEASTLSAATYDVGDGTKSYNPTPLVPLNPPAAPPPLDESDETSVQVVRSFPDSKEFGFITNTPWSTLPRTGVHEVKRTFQTMLNAAQQYIYIEDQAFDAVDSLFPSLVAACKRGVKVIAVVPGQADQIDGGGIKPPAFTPQVKSGLLAKLAPAEQQNLAIWQLKDTVVHSKLILIDDELMSIGSANFMDRSMQFTYQGDDSECTVVAVSTGDLVPDLRVHLWSEHLGVPEAGAEADEIRDLTNSLGIWRPAWGAGVTFTHPDSNLAFIGPA